ncbi:hypothetical protein [Methyloceanibacter sp.]|uniref:hypothetical protein n=1 Tax=Methyloceanibacter sp. TaxID=1965321 RepID=UPI002BABCC53|nr:hypothetical protein [Methyloceanibacter sp.]HML92935.1 hypothetical protein [Methyloceanibacter sp.]
MKETDEETAGVIPPATSNNDTPQGGQAAGSLDPRFRLIARAIGRHIAREHMRAWEDDRRKREGNTEE